MTLDRIRQTYDTVAARYAAEIADELSHKPLDRAMLDAFAALIGSGAPVIDAGCGPGHVTAYLAARGVAIGGIDLSPAMIELARGRHPEIDFQVGDLTALAAADGAWAGAVALYSIIHLPAAARALAYAELARAIRRDGWLLVAFHVSTVDHPSGDVLHLAEWWSHAVDLDAHFLDPAEVAAGLGAAGFVLDARLDREPIAGAEYPSRRGYLLLRRA